MDKKKFDAVLILIVPQVISLISKNYGCDEITASKEFYESQTYRTLEQQETALWHFSALTLFNIFDGEKETGKLIFPEEG